MKRILFWGILPLAALAVVLLVVAVSVRFLLFHRPSSPDQALEAADRLAWLDNWAAAEPMFASAELDFVRRGESAKALYAHVSRLPARMDSGNIPDTIVELNNDLKQNAAQDPITRLRILVVLGLFETNYDAGLARVTWQTVETLGRSHRQYSLAYRAVGEQGIASFFVGDLAMAKRQVITAWTIAKYTSDTAAQIRYSSVFGAGLIELGC